MKRFLLAVLAALTVGVTGPAQANTGGAAWDTFPAERLNSNASLQNGAKLFVNYCLNCHQASFMRFNRLREIGLTDEQIRQNLVFSGGKVGEMMTTPIKPLDAKKWFGTVPPDLSLVTRSRSGAGGTGSDYVYTFLRSFYRDPAKATGWNNTAFPNVAMPNALWPMQGQQHAAFETVKDPHGGADQHVFKGFSLASPGDRTPEQFNSEVADIVAFMTWMGEPAAHSRVRIGVWVMLFLALMFVLAWRLNAAYWKDVK